MPGLLKLAMFPQLNAQATQLGDLFLGQPTRRGAISIEALIRMAI